MSRFYKIISWILILIMLCMSIPGSLAASASETVDGIGVLYDVLASFDEHPAAGKYLYGTDSVNEYCLKIYNYIDQEKVQKIFYGGFSEAADLLKQLNLVLYEDRNYSDVGLEEAETYYLLVWAAAHMDNSSGNISRQGIKEAVKGMYDGVSEKIISDAANICVDYIKKYEPDLISENLVMNSYPAQLSGSDEYVEYFQKGVQLFEEGKYTEAITAYSKSLEYKENDLKASFEIIEAYIAMRNFTEAKDWLMKIVPYITDNSSTAKWLRRLGFIEIENANYEMAYALYAYSLEFEESTLAKQELEYIKAVAPGTKELSAKEAAAYLEKMGVSFGK